MSTASSRPIHRPTGIDVVRHESVTVVWEDGHVSRFDLNDLRLSCQCAECRALRDRGEVVWPRPGAPQQAAIVSADTVGAWGLGVVWNDGHSTGIYTWDMLRAWCPCETCQAQPGHGTRAQG